MNFNCDFASSLLANFLDQCRFQIIGPIDGLTIPNWYTWFYYVRKNVKISSNYRNQSNLSKSVEHIKISRTYQNQSNLSKLVELIKISRTYQNQSNLSKSVELIKISRTYQNMSNFNFFRTFHPRPHSSDAKKQSNLSENEEFPSHFPFFSSPVFVLPQSRKKWFFFGFFASELWNLIPTVDKQF